MGVLKDFRAERERQRKSNGYLAMYEELLEQGVPESVAADRALARFYPELWKVYRQKD